MKNNPEPDSDESSDDDLSEDLPEDSTEEGMHSPSRKRRSLSDGSRTPSKRKRLDDDVRTFYFLHNQSLTLRGCSDVLACQERSATSTMPR